MTLVPSRPNSKRNTHSLGKSWPSCCGGVNVHFCAACMARRAKYWLGPKVSNFAPTTFPEGSTDTRTLTLTCPVIVLRALRDTSGTTSWATAPATGSVGEAFDAAVPSDELFAPADG